jgi:hypothetical protein
MNKFAIVGHEFSGKSKVLAMLIISALLYTLPLKNLPAYLCLGGLGSYVALLLIFIHQRPFSSPANIYRILPLTKGEIYFQTLLQPISGIFITHLLLFIFSVTEPLSFTIQLSALFCTFFTYFCARCFFWVYHYNTSAFFISALISGLLLFYTFTFSEPFLLSAFALVQVMIINIRQECF